MTLAELRAAARLGLDFAAEARFYAALPWTCEEPLRIALLQFAREQTEAATDFDAAVQMAEWAVAS